MLLNLHTRSATFQWPIRCPINGTFQWTIQSPINWILQSSFDGSLQSPIQSPIDGSQWIINGTFQPFFLWNPPVAHPVFHRWNLPALFLQWNPPARKGEDGMRARMNFYLCFFHACSHSAAIALCVAQDFGCPNSVTETSSQTWACDVSKILQRKKESAKSHH